MIKKIIPKSLIINFLFCFEKNIFLFITENACAKACWPQPFFDCLLFIVAYS